MTVLRLINTSQLAVSVIVVIILGFCFYPGRYASYYTYINTEDIISELEPAYLPKINACITTISTKNSDLLYPDENPKQEPDEFAKKLGILPGGQWKPANCQAIYNVAIILPYRNRLKQLNIFMNYIHPFLQFQNLNYKIFVIEQSETKEFNRAKLFNIGFIEALKISDFHCFIFHDIDLIPQNLNNIYACTKLPRHMSSSVNTLRYNLLYKELFGGAVAITKQQFEKVNGFSNIFFGWGGEDDDFYLRLLKKGLTITRFGPNVAQYYMLIHKKEAPSKERFNNLESGTARVESDGVNNVEYAVLNHKLKPLFSWVLVDV